MEGTARLLQRDLGDLLVDEQRRAGRHKGAHADQPARGDLFRLPHALLAGDEGHHLHASDDVALHCDVILRMRIRRQVGHQVEVPQPRCVDGHQSSAPRHQRKRSAVDLADAHSVAGDGHGKPAPGDVFVNVARLQLENVQLFPCRRIDGAHIRFREHAAFLQAADVASQDEARCNLLPAHDPPLVHGVSPRRVDASPAPAAPPDCVPGRKRSRGAAPPACLG